MSINPVLNVKDFISYQGTFEPLPLFNDDSTGMKYSALVLPLPTIFLAKEMINAIMDEQIMLASHGIVCCYLVRWKGSYDTDATWITEKDFCQLELPPDMSISPVLNVEDLSYQGTFKPLPLFSDDSIGMKHSALPVAAAETELIQELKAATYVASTPSSAASVLLTRSTIALPTPTPLVGTTLWLAVVNAKDMEPRTAKREGEEKRFADLRT
ncbi:hypothetical protein K1719_038967 [Acacia pycnantha]|nr:hypothetical protein K1719_038967 [Acacia pycnantha]